MSFMVLQGAIEQGIIYALVSLGIYISFRTLDIADLTTDGTFTLGAATSAILTTLGHPILGILVAMIAGALAGMTTAFFQTRLRIQPILAGIITMTALYSINLMVMGNRPNLPLLKNETIFTLTENIFGEYNKLIVVSIIVIIISIFYILFFKTQLGLSIRATGDNKSMVSASSINPSLTITIGLCLANSLVALSGALLAQYQRFSANDLGVGMVVIGLASLIIGEVVFGRKGVTRCIIGSVVGAIIYRIIIAFAMTSNIVSASNLKLLSAIIVVVAISFPTIKSDIAFKKQRKAGKYNAKA